MKITELTLRAYASITEERRQVFLNNPRHRNSSRLVHCLALAKLNDGHVAAFLNGLASIDLDANDKKSLAAIISIYRSITNNLNSEQKRVFIDHYPVLALDQQSAVGISKTTAEKDTLALDVQQSKLPDHMQFFQPAVAERFSSPAAPTSPAEYLSR